MQSTTLYEALNEYLKIHNKDGSADVFLFTTPPERKFGDICINIFPAVKSTKTPPPQLAQEVLEFMKTQSYVTDGNIQGGFVNLFVTDEFYQKDLETWSLPVFEKKDEKIEKNVSLYRRSNRAQSIISDIHYIIITLKMSSNSDIVILQDNKKQALGSLFI